MFLRVKLVLANKMASTSKISLPDNIQPRVSTTLAWDNIDGLKETLSGELE